MKIFVSGFSGVGKTTFIHQISELFGLPKIHEVIRSTGELSSYDQTSYYEAYLNIHRDMELVYFVCDRTIADVVVWNQIPYEQVIEDLGDSYSIPDLIIMPPVPSIEWMIAHKNFYFDDPIRLNAYKNRLNFSDREMDFSDPANQLNFLFHIHRTFIHDETALEKFYQQIGWKYQKISIDYFSWQNKGLGALNEFEKTFRKTRLKQMKQDAIGV